MSERVCDLFVLFFTLWTLCCHTVVALGGSFRSLLTLFPATLVVAFLVWGLLARRRNESPASVGDRRNESPSAGTIPSALPTRLFWALGLAAGISGGALVLRGASALTLWWAGLATLLLACGTLPQSRAIDSPVRSRRLEIILWTLSACCLVLTLISHRPDWDDSFYVNIAVAAVDHPDEPILTFDTLHGIEGLPLHLPVYRIHSLELLNGAISRLTGLPAISVFHWITAAAMALLVPLAQARLFRLLLPRWWIWGVTGVLVILVGTGDVHRWYGNFSLVRIWQGKSVFLSVLLPLVFAYALHFSLRPSARRWLLLAAAQVASIGCTSSALWAAPTVAALGLLCGVEPSRRGLGRLGIGMLSTTYVLLAGLVLKETTRQFLSLSPPPIAPGATASSPAIPGADLHEAFEIVLGDSRLFVVAFAAILLAWAVSPRGLGRRFAILVPVAVWSTLLNPYLSTLVMANVTGDSYWRALWALPIPALMTLLLLSPLSSEVSRCLRGVGWLSTLVLLVSYVLLVPERSSLSPKNKDVVIGSPHLKVPHAAYEWAARINESVPPEAVVLAPPMISMWIPTFHHHAFPLEVRHYLNTTLRRAMPEEWALRESMTLYVAGQDTDLKPPEFREGLDRFSVRAVLLRRGKTESTTLTVPPTRFRKTAEDSWYELWVREPSSP